MKSRNTDRRSSRSSPNLVQMDPETGKKSSTKAKTRAKQEAESEEKDEFHDSFERFEDAEEHEAKSKKQPTSETMSAEQEALHDEMNKMIDGRVGGAFQDSENEQRAKALEEYSECSFIRSAVIRSEPPFVLPS